MKTEELKEFMQLKFENLVQVWENNRDSLPDLTFAHGSRNAGVHASALLASDKDFCYREQVLSLVVSPKSVNFGSKLLRIFLEGTFIHMKWQMLFKLDGIAVEIEEQGVSDSGMSYTPDAIIRLFKKYWVVEIKSMNTYAFQKLTKPPAGAVDQCNIYMMEKGIDQGIVLVEDKNTQDIKVWPIEYDPDNTRRPVRRLKGVNKALPIFKATGKLPKRICPKKDCGRAKKCHFAEKCFSRRK